jgi:hypothetical protein
MQSVILIIMSVIVSTILFDINTYPSYTVTSSYKSGL